MHLGLWFNPFTIKLIKLASILRTIYRLFHSHYIVLPFLYLLPKFKCTQYR